MDPKFRRLYIIFVLSAIMLIGGGQFLIQYHISLLENTESQVEWLDKLSELKLLEYGVSLFVLSILMGEMFFLFRPAIRAMKFYKNKVGLINQELQASNTQLILSEKKLKQYVKELRKQEAALKIAKLKAEEASHRKGQYLSTMTHEIRTPLHAVTGIAHVLIKENPSPEQIEYLEMLRFSADNLMVLINDILDFNKIEAGRIELEETSFNLSELIQGIQQSLAYKAREKNIDLALNIEGEIPATMLGDPVRISQILNNLVGNAIKFTENGRVTIKVNVTEENDKLVNLDFEVADTGIGIPKDKLDTIFDDFTQASTDTTRKFGGSGLGLSITKQLLKLMGSDIAVKSEEGAGSTFNFTLQLEKKEEQKAEGEYIFNIESEKQFERTVRILLVEDNDINRVIAGQILKKWNLETEYAENGLVALEKLRHKQYDLILMDLQMPNMDGFETALAIRAMEGTYYQTVPIIALTASATTEAKSKVYDHGMNGFFTKPFKPNELFRTIVQHLDLNLELQNTPSKEFQLHSKIEEFCEGDQEFKSQLTGLYIRSFDELKNDYKVALENKDLKKLSFIIHKHRTTIILLELSDLLSEMEKGREFITLESMSEKAIQESVAKVITMCDEILSELSLQIKIS